MTPQRTLDERVLLGMLTPSSNTVLEPLTAAMLAGVPGVSAHFSRFRVTEISLGPGSQRQFVHDAMTQAARLLADARVRAIVWNGTSASWLGFERDEALCREIAQATGIGASTSVLALNEIFTLTGVRRFGLVTPYLDEVQERIVANYGQAGFACVGEEHYRERDNFSFAGFSEERIARSIRAVAAARPEAIAVLCTNLRGAGVVPALERELGIPVYDSVATAVWKALRLAGADPARVVGWGRLFAEVR
jgi:maleate isomerase